MGCACLPVCPAALRVLNLNANHLYGSLPPALGRLRQLEQFLVGSNRLTGAVPPYLATFPTLRYVGLDNNQFTGGLWGWGWGSCEGQGMRRKISEWLECGGRMGWVELARS